MLFTPYSSFQCKSAWEGTKCVFVFQSPSCCFLFFHLVTSFFSFQKLSLAPVKWKENATPSQLVKRLTFSTGLIADFTFFCIRLLCPCVYFLRLSDSEPTSWIIPSSPSLHGSYFWVKINYLSIHLLINCLIALLFALFAFTHLFTCLRTSSALIWL